MLEPDRATFTRTSIAVLAAAGVELVIAAVVSLTPNPDGWAGGVFFALAYSLPLALLGFALRASRRWLLWTAGVAAGVLGLFFAAIPVGNWSGYNGWWEQGRALAATVPAVVACAIVFWAAIVHRGPAAPKAEPR